MKSSAAFMLFAILSYSRLTAAPFHFQLAWDDSSDNLPDRSSLNIGIAGASGRVTIGPDAHLYAGGVRQRFLGINVTHSSCFPEHDDADKIAARLAKFGINLVRFHLMDASWNPAYSIFLNPTSGTRNLNPVMLERLDYFTAQLKARGIYWNLNLLAGRDFKAADGLPSAIDGMDWKAKQTPAMFNPAMITLQREYAQALLAHVNAYTGTSYAADPALAFVEVCNEHGLLHAWRDGMMDSLPVAFADELRVLWNVFLVNRYANQAALSSAWTFSTSPGAELLTNPGFVSGMANWNFEQHNGAAGTAVVFPEGPGGIPACRLSVSTVGTEAWHVQLNQGGLTVAADTVYTLRFSARADRAKTIGVEMGMAHDPWQLLGLQKSVNLTTSWQSFTYTFVLPAGDPNARLNFNRMHDEAATFWFADLSLAPGGSIGLFPGEDLDAGTVRSVLKSEEGFRTSAAKLAWVDFLYDLEKDYWTGIRDYVKGTLGVQALLMGTVVGNTTPNLMDDFDVVDSHAYWHHPSMPTGWGGPWWIDNWSMVEDTTGGTIRSLAMKRVAGKPFSLSEYNHPFPMSFDSETPLWMAAYAALQDWDAIYAYTYNDGNRNWDQNKMSSYFDWDSQPGKMANLIMAANLFRRADVAPAETLVGVSLSEAQEKSMLPAAGPWRLVDAEMLGVVPQSPLLHRISMSTGTNPTAPAGSVPPASVSIPAVGPFVSDTSQLSWNPTGKIWTVDSPSTKGVLGYSMGQSFSLGGVSIRPTSSLQGWGSYFMTEQDGNNLSTNAQHILLNATGFVTNTGTDYRISGTNAAAGSPPAANQAISLAAWGTSPILVEGLGAQVVLPYPAARVSVWALDGKGDRAASVPVASESGNARFNISSTYQTIWYEIAVTQPASATHTPTPSPTSIPTQSALTPSPTPSPAPSVDSSPRIWPNPWRGESIVNVRVPASATDTELNAALYTSASRKVHSWKSINIPAGAAAAVLPMPDISKPVFASGLYRLQIKHLGKSVTLPLGVVR